MASNTIYLTGTASWARVFETNRDRTSSHAGVQETLDKTDGQYTMDIYLEKEEVDKLTKSGSRLKPNIGEDGIFFKLKRGHKHPAGIEELGGPPQIVDADGNDWGTTPLIGNGSKVTVAVEVYDTKMGKGTRLSGIKVLDLVEFESEVTDTKEKLPF